MEDKIDDNTVTWLEHTRTIDGVVWVAGRGALPCNVMFIGEHPCKDDITYGAAFNGPPARLLYDKAKSFGFDMTNTYMTNIVKFVPMTKSLSVKDIKTCAPLLQAELTKAQPKLIVTLGAKALGAVMGKGYKLADYRGTVLTYGDPANPVKVFPMYSPSAIIRDPDLDRDYNADWRMLTRLQKGSSTTLDKPDYQILRTADEVEWFKDWFLKNSADKTLVIDCEWDGENYMDNTGWIRTIQLGFMIGQAVIIELFDENAKCINQDEMAKIIGGPLKQLLEHPDVKLIGHHMRSDGEWLASYGIDIKPTSYYDTMVAEHTINSVGPFGLEALTVKYTNMGRYDFDLLDWVDQHPELTERGYGKVPSAILMPYGACDVDAPRRIRNEQLPQLKQFMSPRGPYPSLWDIDMHTSVVLYEIETSGLLVNKDRLDIITGMYRERRDELEGILLPMAESLGMKDFNFRSPPQRSKLLFDVLQLTPIETTEGKSWDWILNQDQDVQEMVSPATSKETMAILADMPGAHPIVALLRDISKLDYVCRSWLTDPANAKNFNTQSRGGGLLAKIWPDGRIHARFSQLKETARFGSARPNVQNWLKRAEGELKRIIGKEILEKYFGAGAKFPTLRSIIQPPPGWVLMEADWKQAEMFILAALSHDQTMWAGLNTPGKDLHDLTAITAFGLTVLGPDGNQMPEHILLDLAKRDKKAFEQLQSQLIYLDQRGRRLTRKQFKDGIRVSAKNLNFGKIYLAIAA